MASNQHISWTNAHNVMVTVPMASIGTRMVAFILDGIIKWAYIAVLIFIVSELFVQDPGPWSVFILVSPYIFYSFLFETLNDGQTPGKRICKIKVTAIDGQQAGSQAFFLRWIFRLIDFSLISPIVALLTAAMTQNRQRLGDLVANTVVVDTRIMHKAKYDAYTDLPQSYRPRYKQAKRILREDIVLIKDLLRMEMGPVRDGLVQKLYDKICSTYQIHTNDPPRRFLFTLVKDYNFYLLHDS